ncbi:hypothetical protein [Methanohalobium sp.]|uniref:hypothetical protein n=1 Tax=Methanohalobium sp. TaxID=2837493 RepID=UPI0025FBCCC1|nr:hypothetical protein [Methanohalobium sp.]
MFTSLVSTSTTTSAGAAVNSMMTSIGLTEYGVIGVVALILLLSMKEILSASKKWNNKINTSLNMGILPLMVSFSAIVIYKVLEII